ncbi:MAG: hypothetical protein WCV58_00745 [Patescibacteria group bacterium]|jgi:hypothetical protein
MFLTDDEITQFQAIYRQQFGKEISQEDARERGTKLVRLFEIIYKPMTIEEYKTVQKRRKELKP